MKNDLEVRVLWRTHFLYHGIIWTGIMPVPGGIRVQCEVHRIGRHSIILYRRNACMRDQVPAGRIMKNDKGGQQIVRVSFGNA